MITVETTAQSTRVTIPNDEVPPKRLRPFLDWLRLEATAQHSELKESEADQMAEDLKADWWVRNKARFTDPPAQ